MPLVMSDLPAHSSPIHRAFPVPSGGIYHYDLTQQQPPSDSEDGSLPPSLLSPSFTPNTSGFTTPTSHSLRPPRSTPVDTSLLTQRPRLLEELPNVHCVVRARIPTTSGAEMFLHLYQNDVDNKEHLAIVFGSSIRSRSLDAVVPGETEMDRMIRGAYVGTLHPGRASSWVEDENPKSAAALERSRKENLLTTDKWEGANATDAVVRAERPLVRIHSECYTGETAWSARCDCGEQLDEAARLMSQPSTSENAGGVIVYLRQEGRGIGLGEKLKAYNLQDLGRDTVQANEYLRHPADARSYGLATAILMDFGLGGEAGIRLLTNNPKKVAAVEGPAGEVKVRERVAMIPLSWRTGGKEGVHGKEIEKYLETKVSLRNGARETH